MKVPTQGQPTFGGDTALRHHERLKRVHSVRRDIRRCRKSYFDYSTRVLPYGIARYSFAVLVLALSTFGRKVVLAILSQDTRERRELCA